VAEALVEHDEHEGTDQGEGEPGGAEQRREDGGEVSAQAAPVAGPMEPEQGHQPEQEDRVEPVAETGQREAHSGEDLPRSTTILHEAEEPQHRQGQAHERHLGEAARVHLPEEGGVDRPGGGEAQGDDGRPRPQPTPQRQEGQQVQRDPGEHTQRPPRGPGQPEAQRAGDQRLEHIAAVVAHRVIAEWNELIGISEGEPAVGQGGVDLVVEVDGVQGVVVEGAQEVATRGRGIEARGPDGQHHAEGQRRRKHPASGGGG